MLQYFKKVMDIRRAKRVTKEYPTHIDIFDIAGYGEVRFANWDNPLVLTKKITSAQVGFFKKFLTSGDVAIDIGANIGHMTIPMGLAVGKSGTCIAFDPNPIVYKILSENALLNPENTNIVAYNNAITKEATSFYYHSSEASFNNGGISLEPTSRHGKYVLPNQVIGIELESFMEKEYPTALEKLKLIKIDTEGYDKEIVASIIDLLKKYKPAIISECFGKMPTEKKIEYFDLLTCLGYSLYYFSDFDSDAKVEAILKKEDMLRWKHFDFYALPQ